jgi:ketosteroid isomerase-like protein
MRIRTMLIALLVTSPAAAQSRDSAAILATVQAFHDALTRGDSTAALVLLAPDVVILESGDRESRAEYQAHHLAADIEFSREVRGEDGPRTVTILGDCAWVVGTNRSTGTFRGRTINSAGAELMVLTRTSGGWRIRAIHWSSRNIRPPSSG